MGESQYPFVFGVLGGLAGAVILLKLSSCRSVSRFVTPNKITRWRDSPRSFAVLEHRGIVLVSGQVCDLDKLDGDITAQTEQTLKKIDDLLAEAGTNKEQILTTQIWLRDIDTDFAAMNEVWNKWVHPTNKGVRACVEAKLARPQLLVEVKVVAAMP